ncbi:WhiB family transcriptional regulator [Streptomyces sp. NPDC049577]|uniref:WhiB family transcriptional regulator n=1 Tax=Streptomyces sp. NPDC049577 TaxID=3155153 RepID=UPI0034468DC8
MTTFNHARQALPRTTSWRERAACQFEDPELFFPEAETVTAIQIARRFCISSGCPVIKECLNSAMKEEGSAQPKFRYGVWGATGPSDRYKLYLGRERRPS